MKRKVDELKLPRGVSWARDINDPQGPYSLLSFVLKSHWFDLPMRSIHISGKVSQKARHRSAVTRSGKIRHYTPKKTRQWEAQVRMAYDLAYKGAPMYLGPVLVVISVSVPRPAGHWRKGGGLRRSARRFPTVKPDWDNVGKAICDALNGLAYKDDKQVIGALVLKQYTRQRGNPGGVQVDIIALDRGIEPESPMK